MFTVRNILLGIALLVIIGVIISGFMLFMNSSQELDAKGLKQQLLTVSSYANEGKLLAVQQNENKVTASYTKAQSDDLSSQVKTLKKSLQKSKAKNDIEKQKGEAVFLTGQVEQSLEKLHESPDDKQLVNAVVNQLETVSGELGKLHKQL